MASGRNHGGRHSKQPEHSASVAAAVITNANVKSAASKGGKSSKGCLSGGSEPSTFVTTEELLEQCKCPISLELMRRPVLPSSGDMTPVKRNIHVHDMTILLLTMHADPGSSPCGYFWVYYIRMAIASLANACMAVALSSHTPRVQPSVYSVSARSHIELG